MVNVAVPAAAAGLTVAVSVVGLPASTASLPAVTWVVVAVCSKTSIVSLSELLV